MPDPQQAQSQTPDYSNIQLDMSKAQPVSNSAPPDYSNVQLDMSKAQPVKQALPVSQSPYQQEPVSGVDLALDSVFGPGASGVKHAFTGPGTFLGTETPAPIKQEGSGVSDIVHGNIRQGLGKIVGAETWHVIPGSPIEKVIQRFDPDFHGSATPEVLAEAERTNALTKPVIDAAQFIDKQKHPALKAAAEAAQSLTTPENIAIMAATGGFGMVESPKALAVANRLLSTGFSAQAIAQMYQHFKSFKEAYDAGDSNEAVYQATHAILSGAMATTAGMHAAGKEMPFASEFDKKIAGKAVDAIGNISTKASDAISTALGISQNFDTVVKNISKPSAKQYTAYKEKIANVSQDLQSILNNSKQPIEEPKQFANAIDTHIQTHEAELQRQAGETKDSNTPVAPDVQKRISDRLDTFFDEHKGFYGDDSDVAAAKAKILGRILQTRNGQHLLEPNLFEAENVRRGLNEDAKPQFATNAQPTTNAYKAGALEAANELRGAIDESFKKNGVQHVQEWRRKEADLIDIRDRIESAQKKAEDMGQPGLWKAITGKIGAPSTIIAAAFGHLPGIGLAAAGVGADYIHQQATNPNALVERAAKLAGRNPDATAVEPVRVPFAQEGPGAAPVSVQPIPQSDQSVPAAQALPPPAVQPNPRENTPIHADLMTHYSESPGETPYNDLENRFLDDIRIKKENRVALEPAEKTLLGKINQAKVKEILDAKRQAEKAQKEAQQKLAKGDFSDIQLDMTKAQPVAEEPKPEEQTKQDLKKPTKLESAVEDEQEIKPVGSHVAESNQPIQKTPPEHMATGFNEDSFHHHEYGHLAQASAEGIEGHEFISHEDPRIQENNRKLGGRSPGGVTYNQYPYIAEDNPDRYTPEEIADNTMKWLRIYMAGGAANEVLDGIDPKTNKGLSGDMRQARNILMLHGLDGAEADEMIRQAYDETKQHLTNPEIQASIRTNAKVREELLPARLHASAARVKNFQEQIRGLNEKLNNQGSNASARTGREASEGTEPAKESASQAGPAQAPRPREELKTKNDIASAANEFNRENGRAAVNPEPIKHSPETAMRIADAYDSMKHEPENPAVQQSYQAAKQDIDKQFDFATDKMGLKLEHWTHEGQPYANSKEMTQDVKNNKHLYFFTGGEMPEGHPLAEVDPKTGLTYNDKLRAVHDLFGHAAHEFQFGPKGEEQAWNVHRQMFSPEAIPAITSETRGQNSWVNFGNHLRNPEGQVPDKTEEGYVPPAQRPYAEQKAGLLPPEFHQPTITQPTMLQQATEPTGAKDVLERLQEQFKPTTDVSKMRAGATFLTPDGKIVPIGMADHRAIIHRMGYNADTLDDRVPFLNESGAVRTNFRVGRQGPILAVSVPREGITPDQIDLLKQAIHPLLGRTGNLMIETADSPSQVRSEEKEFASAADVEPMLRKIQAHPEQHQISQLQEDEVNHPEDVFWHGSPSGELKGSPYGLHVGTKQAATEALESRIGIPAKGSWDGTREYGKTLLAGQDTLQKRGDSGLTGYNVDAPSEDYYPDGKAVYSDGTPVALTSKPNVFPVKLIGKMTNTYQSPLGDSKANASMMGQLKKGTAKRGYYYKNIFEDPGSVSAVVPSGEYIQAMTEVRPIGSSVGLMQNPLPIKPSGESDKPSTVDVATALNKFTKKQFPALQLSKAEPEEMVARAKSLAEDEARYQLAQNNHGAAWYTTDMAKHDDIAREMRPELADPAKLSVFKMAEAILSSGQKPYGNYRAAIRAWDDYQQNGKFSPVNPENNRSWGPRNIAAYGNAFESLNRLIDEKGEQGASDWLLSDHTIKELRDYNPNVGGRMTDEVPGAYILGPKRGPFAQNLHGLESAFTADMWVARTWNRWMGTQEIDPQNPDELQTDRPRSDKERKLMKQTFSETADKLGMTTSSLQAVLWYYEQALYSAHGSAKESWSFSDAAQRAKDEEDSSFNFGANEKPQMKGGLKALSGKK